MQSHHKYVGLDVHKERNEVASADSSGEVRVYGSISNDLHALEKLVGKVWRQCQVGPPALAR